jgi:O-methyltransferase involved in polyketide biosynthesis
MKRKAVTSSLDIQLSGVPRTLPFEELDKATNPSSEFFQVARARAMDDLIRGFLARNPKATIVNLGAGFDTAFYRIDNGLLRWFDVDLPQVIMLRKQLIPDTTRSRCVSASLLDPEWVRAIGPTSDGVFLFASGVLIYFRKAELQHLFSLLVDSFPGGELAFDTQSKMSAIFGNAALRKAGMGSARLQWGVRSAKPILRLHRGLEMVDQFVTFSKFAVDHYSDERLKQAAKVMDWMRTMTIIHVRLKRSGRQCGVRAKSSGQWRHWTGAPG